MKRRSVMFVGILGVVVLVALPIVYGQSEERVIATIPFAFTAGTSTLPAGEYTISQVPNTPGIVLIRSQDNHTSVFFGTESAYAIQIPQRTELVFNEVGDRYFLSQIWIAGEDLGRELPKPRAERELERSPAKQMAKLVRIPAGPGQHS
jgi:hypothetical protein